MKQRLVFETEPSKKSTLSKILDIQGKSLTEWFEEQLFSTIGNKTDTYSNTFSSISHPRELSDPIEVMQRLKAQDWSFENDDTGYLTHDIHPYPAKFIPQIPAALISYLSLPSDLILDPFGGSGTTAAESVRLGRRAISTDANPIAALIGKVKTASLLPDITSQIEHLLAAIETNISPFSKILFKSQYCAIPDIPNIDKWFTKPAITELSLIRHLIEKLTQNIAKEIANLALSRIIIRVSNQDSETRYTAKDKGIGPFFVLKSYYESLKAVYNRVKSASKTMIFANAQFLCADSRFEITKFVKPNSIGLIVTSPPYPNVTDYHLYHRFRMFWLGFDPKEFGKIEIGSHLKHQRNKSGFEEYIEDMSPALKQCYEVLSPGRYAAFVLGDALFKGKIYDTTNALAKKAEEIGYDICGILERPIHKTRRSFSAPARRVNIEKILILRKPDQLLPVIIHPPLYRMWDYEKQLRKMEIQTLTSVSEFKTDNADLPISLSLNHEARWNLKRNTFSRYIEMPMGYIENTWQNCLEENDNKSAKKKSPKYVTHGIHPYKGKFYPQLAKAIMNISGIEPGSIIFDPFCGSGTVPLEGFLNGYRSYGCDMNPLAAKIANAKCNILTVDRSLCESAIGSLLHSVETHSGGFDESMEQFSDKIHNELTRWFPMPVIYKMNWLLHQIRLFGEHRIVNFFEVILSSCIRDVSQQDPRDLRIRRRKQKLTDARVIELFCERLMEQYNRLKDYWAVVSYKPFHSYIPVIIDGNSCSPDISKQISLSQESVDLIVTSPPYATALPYIDTDRLSLMAIMGIDSKQRGTLEKELTGSREINNKERSYLEELIFSDNMQVFPDTIISALRHIQKTNLRTNGGFRKLNMPSLLWRYFIAMKNNFLTIKRLLKANGKAYYVVGDSKTKLGKDWYPIKTTEWLMEIARMEGFNARKILNISVTTENLKHQKHAITENAIIELLKS